MHIKNKLAEAEKTGRPMFSFEFFPPKTEQVSSVQLICVKLILRASTGCS